jgi:hypothetical protein
MVHQFGVEKRDFLSSSLLALLNRVHAIALKPPARIFDLARRGQWFPNVFNRARLTEEADAISKLEG